MRWLCLLVLTIVGCWGFQLTPERPSADVPKRYVRQPGDPKVPVNPVILRSRLDANLTGKKETVHYVCSKQTAGYFDLWLNLEAFVPITIDCWADNMKLEFNNETKRSEDTQGVDVRVPGFGGTDHVEWLDPSKASQGRYFSPIVDALVSWGYTRSKNIVGAPFDWRKSPPELNDYYIELRTSIETLYRYNHRQPVVVIGHSMGNPVMNYFYHNYVDDAWKSKYIHSHISLAGAWGGAMQIMKLYASGYNMDYYRVILPPSKLRGMQRSFTSSALLFPSSSVWNETDVLARTDKKNYTIANVQEFFTDMNYPIGWEQYKMGNSALLTEAPGVTVRCVYGLSVQTPESFYWSGTNFPDYQPTVTMGDGDGTVNRRSLEVCKQWKGNNGGKPVTVHEVENADHMAVLADARTIQLVKDFLYNPPSEDSVH